MEHWKICSRINQVTQVSLKEFLHAGGRFLDHSFCVIFPVYKENLHWPLDWNKKICAYYTVNMCYYYQKNKTIAFCLESCSVYRMQTCFCCNSEEIMLVTFLDNTFLLDNEIVHIYQQFLLLFQIWLVPKNTDLVHVWFVVKIMQLWKAKHKY